MECKIVLTLERESDKEINTIIPLWNRNFNPYFFYPLYMNSTGHIAQSVTCLHADTFLTADPGVTRLIPAPSHTFLEIGGLLYISRGVRL